MKIKIVKKKNKKKLQRKFLIASLIRDENKHPIRFSGDHLCRFYDNS